jgi:SAM-dependent methyltransferase
VNEFVKEVARELPPGSSILDAGAGECNYQRYFQGHNYISVDLGVGDENWDYDKLDHVAPLDQLPLTDNSLDAILCTQVLEHLERPRESAKEFFRVLRPGGKIYLTAPMSHVEHQTPYDFFRYTSYGLRSILSEAGFEVIVIKPFGGMFTRWAYEIPRALGVLPSLRKRGRVSTKGLIALPLKILSHVTIRGAQWLLLRLERLDENKNDPFGWAVVAVKGIQS